MNGRRKPGDFPSGDELFEAVEDLKRRAREFTGRGGSGGKMLWLIPIVLLLLWLGTGFYVVGPGERGVVLRFGKAIDQTEPGLRYRLPWPIDSHHLVDIAQVRRAEVGFRTGVAVPPDRVMTRATAGAVRTVPQEALMLTGDENIVEVHFFVQYRVQDPVQFLFASQDPETILHSAAEVALRSAVGRNTIDYTMTEGRVEVQEQAREVLQHLLTTYRTGLLVTDARLLVVDPPTEVRDAFHDVVRALEDRERLVREAEGYREDVVPKARGEAAQMVQQAEAYKAQRVIRAQGDAERFLRVLAEYEKAKTVTRDRLYLESMERVMPNIEKYIFDAAGQRDGVVPLLPLKEMVAAPASPGADRAAPSPAERRE
ncbi:MAG: FtsH protease activity modulator HflK [Thermodesulfobacteriota bacterium]|jgi:membrane protease subunit HflK